MECVTIQTQSILYNNNLDDMQRTIENLVRAVEVYRTHKQPDFAVTLSYGDASEEPVLTQQAVEHLANLYAGKVTIQYRYFGENTGHAKGQNILAEQCTSQYIMIMNPDVVVNPRIFIQLLAAFEANSSRIGIAEARQTPIEHAKAYNPKTGETSWATGACFLCPAHVFNEMGGFDKDSFFMYCDDVDFSWRVRLAGYRIQYVPEAPVFHAKSLSPSGDWLPTYAETYYSAEAALLMAYKWCNEPKVMELLALYTASQDLIKQDVVRAYKDRLRKGTLPSQVDPAHTVASFTYQGYGSYRFLF